MLVFICTKTKACFSLVCYFFQFFDFLPLYSQKEYCFSMTFQDPYLNSMTFQAWKLEEYFPWLSRFPWPVQTLGSEDDIDCDLDNGDNDELILSDRKGNNSDKEEVSIHSKTKSQEGIRIHFGLCLWLHWN